ncbi:glycerate kinase family protein [Clostridioides difficile]|uniref:glycerate kinase family protein n=1 Tax=Clostridioides difficile TaxID=1496 RepID=UPI001C143445|nr:glycerate kinase [Clostridioides difficile]MCJ0349727.1 glycerate kinase [Clostridioides difficile]MCL6919377.1 glycerate kinase [Clostridioides difficile]MCU5934865.1 glycerate kinase [Clostridioides difficile]MDL0188448.1 glycerate kinase [Clostridioides difficile]MDL0189234.1 glycerate kinase [Clostridioides difficile]
MKILISIDSLKGSLSSIEAGNAIKKGILKVKEDAQVKILPLADGGEGTVDALVQGMNGKKETIEVTGPIAKKVDATYGLLKNTSTAIIEIAQASGLTLVPTELRNPLYTTTYGVGEIIKEAINKGYRNFIVGIGGSATNDAGIGMLQALGFEFYDKNNKLVGLGGKVLNEIRHIKIENRLKELDECKFKIACDVNNPLFGKNGAAYIYGSQKGATSEIIEELDNGLRNFSKVVKNYLSKDVANVEGAGAAGGLGFAFLAFLNSKLESGIKIILEEIKLEEELKDADFVITGEGRLDNQTAMGKAPIGVAKLAKKYGVKVIGLAGATTEDAVKCNEEGIDAYFSIVNRAMTIEEAMDKATASENMTSTTTQIFNLITSIQQ